MTTTKYRVVAPRTPGAQPTGQPAATLASARQIARTYRDRRDLCAQDVRIERTDGRLVEYGPLSR